MGESKKETGKSASSKAGQALPASIPVAEDNKAIGDLVSRILDFMGFVDSIILKPFFLDDFQSTVQRVLNSRYGEQGFMRAFQRPPTGETLAHEEPGKEAG
ncbi:MAG: hypothetical protein JW836_13200 [Deltaproteobacteria bacterium]|nr:hypothetical protein [Deltaproteobacteria bacterium]